MIVVDASAVVASLAEPESTGHLRELLIAEELHAPGLIDFEVISAIRGLTLAGRLSVERALRALTDYDDLPLRRWPSAVALRRRTFQLRHNVSAYDGAYVALAEALDCPLVTRDSRLAAGAGHVVDIRLF